MTQRRILLATDLSARCDRALERAVALAGNWNAALTIVHAIESDSDSVQGDAGMLPSWQRPPDALVVARARVHAALRADLENYASRADIRVIEGDPATVVDELAQQLKPDLVVVGVASERPLALRPVRLGRTTERLLRRSPAPILVVHGRVRGEYRDILVPTDFSDPSAAALKTAVALFPAATLHLLHAYHAPLASQAPDPARYQAEYADVAAADLEAFLERTGIAPEVRQRMERLVEHGVPEQLIRTYQHDRPADLVVMGTHGRGALMTTLLGSTARSLLATLTCDTLVVRASAAPVDHTEG